MSSWTLTDLLNRVDILLNRPDESARAPENSLQVGGRGPEFSLFSLEGGRVSLSGQLGHPTLVNFWATWCVPCREELPLLKATARAHPDLRILAVNEGEDNDTIRSFLRDAVGGAGPLIVLLDDDRGVGDRYQVVGLPVSVFVDADGIVRSVHVGQLSDELLSRGLTGLEN